ncbi:MAG TPA: hypothetical protein VMV35_05665 [Halothiobacillus sp.]|nr:hypothetical protein [Halothiobacillus sp.]
MAFLCLLVSGGSALADNPRFGALPSVVDEASGLTASIRHPGVYWTHNDNINLPASSRRSEPLLFAINARGELQSTVTLSPIRQRDWEAITSGLIDGQPTLIVGDIGDNRNSWPDYRLWFVPEPTALGGKQSAYPTALIRFRYPDQIPQPKRQGGWSGGHDAEALVLDAHDQQLLLLTKREKPARFFSIPLSARHPITEGERLSLQDRRTPVITAHFIAPLPTLPAPDLLAWLLNPMIGAYADQPTDMTLSRDGHLLVVLTYSALYFFLREPGMDWRQAIERPVDSMGLPQIDQWEGINFSEDEKRLLIVREGRGDRTLMNLSLPESLIARE